MIGSPLLALTFSKGIEMGGSALGMPFFFGAFMFTVSGVSVWCIRSPKTSLVSEEEEEEEA